MSQPTSPQQPATINHEKMLLLAMRQADGPLDTATAAALAHVLGCGRCLLDLAGFWGADGACALVRPHLAAYAAGTLGPELATALATHLAGCPSCPTLLADSRTAIRLASAPLATRAGTQLARALLDAALLEDAAALKLLREWLQQRSIGYSVALRRALALDDVLINAALADVPMGALDEAQARQAALDALREDSAILGELELRLDDAMVGNNLTLALVALREWQPRAVAVAGDNTAPPAQAQFSGPGEPELIVLYDEEEQRMIARVVITDPASWRAAGTPPLQLQAASPPPLGLPWQSWLLGAGWIDVLMPAGAILSDIALTQRGRVLDVTAQNSAILWAMGSLALGSGGIA